MNNEIYYLKLDDIIPNRFQPREVFDESALNELADSIRQHGVIQPIVVRQIGNKYEIIAGERRYKASALAGLTKIPAIIKNLDDKESSIVAYAENAHRRNVSSIEEARTMERILKNNNMTQSDLANELGLSQSALANKLRLLTLPVEVQDSLMKNEISERHARSLLTLKDEKQQLEFLNKIKTNKMTVRELDSEIRDMNNNSSNDINLDNFDKGNINMNINNSTITVSEEKKSDDFMNYLNNPNASFNQVSEPVNEVSENNDDFMNYLNNSSASFNQIDYINENDDFDQYLNPVETNSNNNYIENDNRYVDIEQNGKIGSFEQIIDKLKLCIEEIKNSDYKIDSDEIDFGDLYQITIKIDKRDIL